MAVLNIDWYYKKLHENTTPDRHPMQGPYVILAYLIKAQQWIWNQDSSKF